MRALITLIWILLYLWIGRSLFSAAVKSYGGKEEYKAEMKNGGSYTSALLLVTLFWPVFIVMAVIENWRNE